MAPDNAKTNVNMHVSPPDGRLHSDKKHEGCIVISVLNVLVILI
jgi:hypothetical protein